MTTNDERGAACLADGHALGKAHWSAGQLAHSGTLRCPFMHSFVCYALRSYVIRLPTIDARGGGTPPESVKVFLN
ncbi:hypothetical protein Tcan_07822 [Toxocara canis]|uniref:Uncharacterized protein n=1 Tax=Toxocara canis TaxID=6265 RepID=A0A0B2VYW4_TOXCA|nr:hypothetical protein Tcan_07822 [Toxocara canis]